MCIRAKAYGVGAVAEVGAEVEGVLDSTGGPPAILESTGGAEGVPEKIGGRTSPPIRLEAPEDVVEGGVASWEASAMAGTGAGVSEAVGGADDVGASEDAAGRPGGSSGTASITGRRLDVSLFSCTMVLKRTM